MSDRIDLSPPTMPQSAEAPDKIIDLRGEPLEITSSANEPAGYCMSHCKRIVVDEDTRTIECKECGRIVEPFDYLAGWAKEGDRRMERLKSLDVEITKTNAELFSIKQVLARERAKVRRINPDAPEVMTWKRQLQTRHEGVARL